ncbi:hypothetical protein KHC28_08985 [Ancylobacter sonchi]|uniref:hypothetical protein n=1 Tax=Ancylobacter sonchi TaxID=1937790 RepID=UPI001BD58ED9|nr:hypothetical protein [Ancylobacter sonchi]MBS7533789.1 hypothetical protein [Ancylobacter sonchi]
MNFATPILSAEPVISAVIPNEPIASAEIAIPTLKPTMTRAELEAFSRHAKQARSVIEFGCGHSTNEFIRLGVARVMSVDSDPEWLDRLERIPALGRAKARGRLSLIHGDIGPVGAWGKPSDKSLRGRWSSYVMAPWQLAPMFKPDLVFVDGRFRAACTLSAYMFGPPHVTVMVHDFWNRTAYHSVLQFSEVVEEVERLAVLRPKPDLNHRDLAAAMRRTLGDQR